MVNNMLQSTQNNNNTTTTTNTDNSTTINNNDPDEKSRPLMRHTSNSLPHPAATTVNSNGLLGINTNHHHHHHHQHSQNSNKTPPPASQHVHHHSNHGNSLHGNHGNHTHNQHQQSVPKPFNENYKDYLDQHHISQLKYLEATSHHRKLSNKSFDDENNAPNSEVTPRSTPVHRLDHGNADSGDDNDDDDQHLGNDEDDDDLDDMDDPDGDSFGDNGHRKKKTRTVFSRNQVFQLESTFDMKRYLSSSERSALANSLQLTETQIKIWFQNRRNKWKRQLAAEIESNTNLNSVLNSNANPQNSSAASTRYII